jgi:hypothetical protein
MMLAHQLLLQVQQISAGNETVVVVVQSIKASAQLWK